jgi:hypothetical protein
MQRRTLLAMLAAGSAVSLGGAWWALPGAPTPAALTLQSARQILQQLGSTVLRSEQGWSPAEVFNHCAQSVDYSMDGYPQLKPAWFRQSVGPAVFDLFAARGGMRHPLDEAIPGAPALDEPASQELALQRLQASMQRFADFRGPLQPHFAYGELTHAEYVLAHVMHLYNHLGLIRPA